MSWEDPIVSEVHAIREKLAADFNYDVQAIFADLRKREEQWGDRLVSQGSIQENNEEAPSNTQSTT